MTIFLSPPSAGTELVGQQPSAAAYFSVERVGRRLWRVREPGSGAPVAVLEVIRLDRTDWRVSDSSRASVGDSRLLGYVERLGRDVYEVLWLAPTLGWSYVSSFARALAALADRDRFAGAIEATRRPPLDGQRSIFSNGA